MCRVSGGPVHGFQAGNERIHLFHIPAELKSGKGAAEIEDFLGKTQALGCRQGVHMLGDVGDDVRHGPEIPVRIRGGHADGFELVLNLGLCELAVRLAESGSGKRTFDAHVRQHPQSTGHVHDVILRGSRLGASHLQSLCEVGQRLRRSVRRGRQDVGDIRHLRGLNPEDAHVVCGDLGSFAKLGSRGTGKVQHGGNSRQDFVWLEPHTPHGRHCLGDLFRRVGRFASELLRCRRQFLELSIGRAADGFDHPHGIIEIRESLRGERQWSRHDTGDREHVLPDPDQALSKRLDLLLGLLQSPFKRCLIQQNLHIGSSRFHFPCCRAHFSSPCTRYPVGC